MYFDANTIGSSVNDAERPSSPHASASASVERREEPSVSLCVARALVAAVESAGVPRQRFLRMTRLGPERPGDAQARVPTTELYKACEAALELSLDPALGLHCGQRFVGSTFNIISHLVAHAANLRQALDAVLRFRTLCSDHPGYELIEHEDRVVLRCGPIIGASPRVVRFVSEVQLIGFVNLIRHFCPSARIDQVCLEYSAPEYRGQYTRAFDGAERFEQAFTGLVFNRALLQGASPDRDEEIYSTLSALAEQRLLHRRLNASYALRVRERLLQQRMPGRVAMECVADALKLSVRTLHRRLAHEGRTYRALANEASAIIAKRLLVDERCTIQEVASLMGFSDATSFHRAFKRWTGSTPNAFRQGA
jgi:AraC-like DNA-binding protein